MTMKYGVLENKEAPLSLGILLCYYYYCGDRGFLDF
jgi:hypothetical protein